MNERKVTKIYRTIQYNKMEASQFSKRKDRIGKKASEWMHSKPYGLKGAEDEKEQNADRRVLAGMAQGCAVASVAGR